MIGQTTSHYHIVEQPAEKSDELVNRFPREPCACVTRAFIDIVAYSRMPDRGTGAHALQAAGDGPATSSHVKCTHTGRQGIFSLRMRYAKVVRFIPSRAAAPLGPPITHFDSRRARRTCSRSASSRVLSLESHS